MNMETKNLKINENTDPLEIFKPPFKQWWGIKIMTSESRMAMDLCANISGGENSREKFLQKVCDILNGDSNEKAKVEKIYYNPPYIYFNENKVFLIRGWGYLTGCGGLKLDPEIAEKIQDNFAEWVVSKLLKPKSE